MSHASSVDDVLKTDDFIEVERREGDLLWLKGHSVPYRGVTTPEQMKAVNRAKSLLLKGKIRAAFESIISFDVDSKFVGAFRDLFYDLPYELRETLVVIFYFDEAYRFRLQDLFATSNQKDLFQTPIREIIYLQSVNQERDYPEVARKFKIMAYLLIIWLLWPPNHRRFRKAVEMVEWSKLLPDEIDKYWMRQKFDYKYAA